MATQVTNPTSGKQPVRTPSVQVIPPLNNNLSQGSFTFVFQPSVGSPNEITLVTNPEEFMQAESSTSNVILTAGDIFSDSFGPGLTEIKIMGTFGQRPMVNGQVGSGQQEVLKLRNLFRQYLDEINPIITQDVSRNSGARLFFYNPKDNEFWQIEPTGKYFILKRSKSAPFLYRYEISFVAISRVNNNKFTETLGFYSRTQDQIEQIQNDTQDLLTRAQNGQTGITKTMNSINVAKYIQTTANAIQSGVRNTQNFFNDNVLTPLDQLNAALSNFQSAVTQVINFPIQTLDSISISCGIIFQAMTDAYKLFLLGGNPGFEYDSEFADILNNTILRIDNLKLYSNSFVKTFLKSDFIDQTNLPFDPSIEFIDLNSVKSCTYITIIDGMTIESISLDATGSTENWKSIAEFNGLAYPYITSPKVEKTLTVGDSIAIPSTTLGSLSNNVVLGPAIAPPTTDFSFGQDLLLDPSGDVVVATDNDLQTVSGIDNMKQAISLKLNINRGEILVHPDFGVDDLRGYRTVPLLAARAKSQLDSTMLSDSRVASIESSSVTLNNDIINFTASVRTKLTSSPVVLTGTF